MKLTKRCVEYFVLFLVRKNVSQYFTLYYKKIKKHSKLRKYDSSLFCHENFTSLITFWRWNAYCNENATLPNMFTEIHIQSKLCIYYSFLVEKVNFGTYMAFCFVDLQNSPNSALRWNSCVCYGKARSPCIDKETEQHLSNKTS